MKKRLLPFLAIVALLSMPMQMRAEDIPINETTFPDIYFRDWLKSQSFGQDGVLTESEIAGVTSIEAMNKGISNLKGIEFFTALTKLDCRINQLTSLDISRNTALTVLLCSENQVTSLDVSKNTALTVLSCDGNQLTSLDVSKNTALTGLYCGNNQLASLEVLKNTSLTELHCEDNQLSSLDVSKNKSLYRLECNNNQLTSLDVSKNTALYYFACQMNRIKETEMGYLVESLHSTEGYRKICVKNIVDANEQNVITTAQIAAAKAKGWEVYADTDYGWIDYDGEATGTGIAINSTNFPDENFRSWLFAQGFGQDGALTEEETAGVTFIDFYGWGIADLKGIEYFTALTSLLCDDGQLTSLDISKNTALTFLRCMGQLTSLDVSHNVALKYLDCSANPLTSLDVSKNTALMELLCVGNQLTSLDLSKNTALISLTCELNQLTSLDVSKNTALVSLDSWGNQLTSLDLSKNTALMSLWCVNNQLASLDLSKNTALTELHCEGNQLSSLDISKNTALTSLYCGSNQLTSLDLSKNTELAFLECNANQLTSLDISKNVQLCYLDCSKNRINETEMDKIIWSLPPKGSNTNPSYGSLFVKILDDADEQNVITTSQVRIAKSSEWYVYAKHDGDDWMPYDGDATGIGDAPLMENGPLATDSYFTLDGRKVKGEPTQKGVYIRKRHTVVVK